MTLSLGACIADFTGSAVQLHQHAVIIERGRAEHDVIDALLQGSQFGLGQHLAQVQVASLLKILPVIGAKTLFCHLSSPLGMVDGLSCNCKLAIYAGGLSKGGALVVKSAAMRGTYSPIRFWMRA